MTMNAYSFLDVCAAMGYIPANETNSRYRLKTKTVSEGLITDDDLNGLATSDVLVTFPDYADGVGGPKQFQVLGSGVPSADQVIFNTNTLTFNEAYDGLTVCYAYRKTVTRRGAGGPNSIRVGSFEFLGEVEVSNGGAFNGWAIEIPSMELIPSVALGGGSGIKTLSMTFKPQIVGNNKDSVLLFEN
jgi:hypothetical protein